MHSMKRNLIFIIFTVLALGACSPAIELPIVEEEAEPTDVVGEETFEVQSTASLVEPSIRSLDPEKDQFGQEAFVFTTSSGEEIQYLLYLPENIDEVESAAVMLFLHGTGDNGSNIDDLRDGTPLAWAETIGTFPFIVIAPQLPSGFWGKYFEPTYELIDFLAETLPIDTESIILTGYSRGGYGSWGYALADPERYAALVPVAGGPSISASELVPADICELNKLQIWIFHGDEDGIVPITSNLESAEALKNCGNDSILFTIYEGQNHNGTWQMAYADSALYAWMLEQVK